METISGVIFAYLTRFHFLLIFLWIVLVWRWQLFTSSPPTRVSFRIKKVSNKWKESQMWVKIYFNYFDCSYMFFLTFFSCQSCADSASIRRRTWLASKQSELVKKENFRIYWVLHFCVFRVHFTPKSIPELIRFCLDINCNIKDGGILPKNLCQGCLEKLHVAYELKNKGKESDKYLKEILLNQTGDAEDEDSLITPYNPVAYYEPDELLEELQQPEYDDGGGHSDVSDFSPRRGERQGQFVCKVCLKEFKYSKSYKRHVKQHNVGQITNGGHKRRYKLKKKKIGPAFTKQAPYDSRSPYESPAPYASPARDSSPDFATMVTSSNILGNENAEPVKKRPRLYHATADTTPSRDQSPLLEVEAPTPSTSRSRGRPRKYARPDEESLEKTSPVGSKNSSVAFSEVDVSGVNESNTHSGASRGRGRPRKYPKNNAEEEPSPFADFSEVDVSSMLRKKNLCVIEDDSISQSALSTMRSRSRSSSVELVQEFDIFGSVLPDDGGIRKTGFGSGKTYGCTVGVCSQKFHLKANLKKHLRENHGHKWTKLILSCNP